MKKILSILLALFYTQYSFSQEKTAVVGPYSLNWSTDGWISGLSAIAGIAAYSIESNLPTLSLAEIQALNKNAINPIDRSTAGVYNKFHSTLSDVFVGAAIISPLGLMIDKDLRQDCITIGMMYVETAMLSAIFPSLGKGTAKRIRPFVYGTTASLDKRMEADAQTSFFSRHSTFAFSMAVFVSEVYGDYFPTSKYTSYIWIGSLGIASTVATLRVTSGAHFPTDVIVGAAIGSGIGYLIPYIHRKKSDEMSLTPILSPQYNGISLSLRF